MAVRHVRAHRSAAAIAALPAGDRRIALGIASADEEAKRAASQDTHGGHAPGRHLLLAQLGEQVKGTLSYHARVACHVVDFRDTADVFRRPRAAAGARRRRPPPAPCCAARPPA